MVDVVVAKWIVLPLNVIIILYITGERGKCREFFAIFLPRDCGSYMVFPDNDDHSRVSRRTHLQYVLTV